MKEKYGIIIPLRLKNLLESESFVNAIRKTSNQSATWGELKERVPPAYEELLVLVKKMPREKLFELIPPEKIIEFFATVLEDPTERDKYLEWYNQHKHARELEGDRPDESTPSLQEILREIADETVRRLDVERKKKLAPLQARMAKTKDTKIQMQLRQEIDKIQPTDEDRKRVREQVEKELLKPADRQRLLEMQGAMAKTKDLEYAYKEYVSQLDTKRMKVANSVAVMGIDYFTAQMPKLVKPEYAEWMTGPFKETKYRLSVIMNETLESATLAKEKKKTRRAPTSAGSPEDSKPADF